MDFKVSRDTKVARQMEPVSPGLNTTIVGVDLSLTGTGIAVIQDGGVHWKNSVVLDTIKTQTAGDSFYKRDDRLNTIASKVFAYAQVADLVVIEGPAYGTKGGSAFDRAGLWWRVAGLVYGKDIPMGVANVAHVKKWATNNGGADKTAVAIGVSRLWPEIDPKNDNESDALALATMGGQWLQLGSMPSRAHHDAVIQKVAWPRYSYTLKGTGNSL